MNRCGFEENQNTLDGEPVCLGVDEAGRGPVLGPMVYGVAWCKVSEKGKIAKMSFADSKVLTADKRDTLFTKLKACELVGWAVDIISAGTLNDKMLGRSRVSLNVIAENSTMGLIQVQTGGILK